MTSDSNDNYGFVVAADNNDDDNNNYDNVIDSNDNNSDENENDNDDFVVNEDGIADLPLRSSSSPSLSSSSSEPDEEMVSGSSPATVPKVKVRASVRGQGQVSQEKIFINHQGMTER